MLTSSARLWLFGLTMAGCTQFATTSLLAQNKSPVATPGQLTPRSSSAAAMSTPAAEGTEVTLERQALSLVDGKAYQVPLQLRAERSVTVTASAEGILRSLVVKPGDKVGAQLELARIDDTLARLQVAKAEAEVGLADAQLAAAKAEKDAGAIAIAEARLKVARSGLEIEQQLQEQTSVRAPFEGTVTRSHAGVGQYVRAGDPVLDFVDQSQLRIEVPVDRTTTKIGDVIPLKIEGRQAEATVKSLLPPAERFNPLRDLALSLASAEAVIDNSRGQFQAGQSVFAPLIPRDVVTEIPTAAISNTGEGNRQVQVIRDHVVRNIAVALLAAVGPERTYVSGSFTAGDELVVFSSQPLVDGTEVRRKNATAATAADDPAAPPKTPKANF